MKKEMDQMNVNLKSMNNDLPLISAYARDLLLKGRYIAYTESVAFPVGVKSYPAYYYLDPQKFDFPEDDHLILFPNPSGSFFIIEYDLREFSELGIIQISDLNGRKLSNLPLKDLQNQRIVDTKPFSAGIYLITLFVNDSLIETEKINMIK